MTFEGGPVVKKRYHDFDHRPRPSTTREKLGDRIRDLRIARGLSMATVEKRGGPSITTQSMVESGLVSVQIRTLKAFADALDVRVYEFLLYGDSEIETVAKLIGKIEKKRATALCKKLLRKVGN
ncbi:MAG TPA: helix-turn-helix transcriptional regulator [Polyangium sp.]|nr:helix-turn-helix transcriptional regulator [Polyangium sp.]